MFRYRSLALFGVFDQGVSASSNLVAAILIANQVSTTSFGAISFGMVYLLVGTRLGRSMTGEVLLTQDSDDEHGAATTAAIFVGFILGSLTLVLSILVGGELAIVLRWAAPAVIVSLIHDVIRYRHFSLQFPQGALVLDLIWFVSTVVTLYIAPKFLSPNGPHLFAIWALGPGFALIFRAEYLRGITRLSLGIDFLSNNLHRIKSYLVEFVSSALATHSVILILPTMGFLEIAAEVRATQILFGPIGILFTGLYPLVLPLGIRIAKTTPIHIGRFANRLSACFMVVVGFWSLSLHLGPSILLGTLLGKVWDLGSPYTLLAMLGFMAGGFGSGSLIGLRAINSHSELAKTRLAFAPISIALPLFGAYYANTTGLLLAWAIAQFCLFGLCRLRLARTLAGLTRTSEDRLVVDKDEAAREARSTLGEA